MKHNIAIGRSNIAAYRHRSVDRCEIHIQICRNRFVYLHTSVRFQRDITVLVEHFIGIRFKFQGDLDHTLVFRVFYRNITIDHGLNRKRQLVRAVLGQNIALDGHSLVSTLHCKNAELIAHSLQIHILCAYGSNLLRLNSRRHAFGHILGNGTNR